MAVNKKHWAWLNRSTEHTDLFSYFLFAPPKAVCVTELKKKKKDRLHPFIYIATDQIPDNDPDKNDQSFTLVETLLLTAGFVPVAVFYLVRTSDPRTENSVFLLLIPRSVQLLHLGAVKSFLKKTDWNNFSMGLLEELRGLTWSYSPFCTDPTLFAEKLSTFFWVHTAQSEKHSPKALSTRFQYILCLPGSYNLDLTFFFLSVTLLASLCYGWVTRKQKGIPSRRNTVSFMGWTSLIIHNNYISKW